MNYKTNTSGQQDPNAASAQPDVDLRIEISELTNRVDTIYDTISLTSGILGVCTIFGLLVGWFLLRKWISDKVHASVNSIIDKRADSELTDAIKKHAESAEVYLLGLFEVFALKAKGEFEDALDAFGWSDSDGVKNLRNNHPAVRREIIDCLARAASNGSTNRTLRKKQALDGAQELWKDDKSSHTLYTILRVARKLGETDAGILNYTEARQLKIREMNCDLVAASLYRRKGLTKDALECVEPWQDQTDILTANTIASLWRDVAKPEKGQALLKPHIQAVMSGKVRLKNGWQSAFNSYLACALDRHRPEDAIDAAMFLLKADDNHTVSIFNALLIARALPSDSNDRKSLFRVAEAILDSIPIAGDAVRSMAIVHEENKDSESSLALLKEYCDELKTQFGSKLTSDWYFAMCSYGSALRRNQKINDAISILIEASSLKGQCGEAEYELALCYAANDDHKHTLDYLKSSMDLRRRWICRIRDNSALSKIDGVADLLREYEIELSESRIFETKTSISTPI